MGGDKSLKQALVRPIVLGLVVTVTISVAAVWWYTRIAARVLGVAEQRHHMALVAYGIGWAGLAAMVATDAGKFAVGLLPDPDGTLYTVMVWLKIVSNGLMLAGFVAYVAYLATGRRGLMLLGPLVGIVHSTYWLVNTNEALPGAVHVGSFATRMEYSNAPEGLAGIGFIMFFVPSIACAAAYMLVGRGVDDEGKKRRHRMVSLSLFVFLATAIVQGNPDVSPDSVLLPAGMAIAALAGYVSWRTFNPTRRMQETHGLQPFGN